MTPSTDFEDENPTQPSIRETRPVVLLVEDDDPMRGMIATRMRRVDFEIIEARSAGEALDILRTRRDAVDLVIMEVRLPGGASGLDVARRMRASKLTTPILLITPTLEPDLVARAARLHASLLAKPFPLDRLTDAAIETLLADEGG